MDRRLVVGDGAPLILECVSAALASDPSLQIVAREPSAPGLFEAAKAHQPELILVDPTLWDLPVLRLVAEVFDAAPESRLALLGTKWEIDDILGAVAAGVSIIARTRDRDDLLAAIRAVLRGEHVLDVQRAGDAISSTPGVRLTDRERAVLRGAANGQHASDTGRELHLAEATVKAHLASASRKLGAKTKTHAAVLATRLGIPDVLPLLGDLRRHAD